MSSEKVQERPTAFRVKLKRALFDALVGSVVYGATYLYAFVRRSARFRSAAKSGVRAAILLLVFFTTVLLTAFATPVVTGWLKSLGAKPRDLIEFGKGFAYPLLILAGLPVLFVLWAFRDANERQKIANDRKDVNLKEFQELQLRAAGLFPTDMPSEAVNSLQIASIYQLAGFLRGEYGLSFKRPTYEALRTLAEQFSRKNGASRVIADFDRSLKAYDHRVRRKKPFNGFKTSQFLMKLRRASQEISDQARNSPPVKVLSLNLSTYIHEIPFVQNKFYRFHSHKIDWSGQTIDSITLANSAFSFSKFNKSTIIKSKFFLTNFIRSSLIYSNLWSSYFCGCYFESSRLCRSSISNCKFIQCNFRNCDFRFSNLELCDFTLSNMEETDLRGAKLTLANLMAVNLRNADLRGCDLRGIDPSSIATAAGALMNSDTLICLSMDFNPGGPFELDEERARELWIEKGAVFERLTQNKASELR